MCVEDFETQGFYPPPKTALKTRACKGKIEFEAWLLWWKQGFFPKIQGQQPQDNKHVVQERAWQESMKAGKMWHWDIQGQFLEAETPNIQTSIYISIFFYNSCFLFSNYWLVRMDDLLTNIPAKIAVVHPRVPEKPENIGRPVHFGGQNRWKGETLPFQLRSYGNPYGIPQSKFYPNVIWRARLVASRADCSFLTFDFPPFESSRPVQLRG